MFCTTCVEVNPSYFILHAAMIRVKLQVVEDLSPELKEVARESGGVAEANLQVEERLGPRVKGSGLSV